MYWGRSSTPPFPSLWQAPPPLGFLCALHAGSPDLFLGGLPLVVPPPLRHTSILTTHELCSFCPGELWLHHLCPRRQSPPSPPAAGAPSCTRDIPSQLPRRAYPIIYSFLLLSLTALMSRSALPVPLLLYLRRRLRRHQTPLRVPRRIHGGRPSTATLVLPAAETPEASVPPCCCRTANTAADDVAPASPVTWVPWTLLGSHALPP